MYGSFKVRRGVGLSKLENI